MRRRTLLGLAAALLLSPLPLAPPAQAAVAPAGPVLVADVPTGDRFTPRGADVLGANDTGFLYLLGGDTGAEPAYTAHFRTYDGSRDVVIPEVAPQTELRGDRLVTFPRYALRPVLRTRLLSDTDWTDVPVPPDTLYVGATADGILTTSAEVPLQLTPWAGGSSVPVGGLPAGSAVAPFAPSPLATVTGDAHGAAIDLSSGNGRVYVDTSLRHAWALPSNYATVGPRHLAWNRPSGDGASLDVVTVPRPRSSTDVLPETVLPAPGVDPSRTLAALADGSVLVGRQLEWYQYDPSVSAVVRRLAPDGTMSTELSWGHGITAVPSGGYLAVTGTEPRTARIQRVPVAGGPGTAALVLPAVPASAGALALAGARLVLSTDASPTGAVQQHAIDTSPGTLTVASAEVLTEGAYVDDGCDYQLAAPCGGVAAGSGGTAWTVGGSVQVQQPNGTRSTFARRGTTVDLARRVEGDHVLVRDRFDFGEGGALYERVTGELVMGRRAPGLTDAEPLELDADVVYWGTGGSVALRQLSTGATASLAVPGCLSVRAVQSAGPWLLVGCGETQRLLDRRDGSTTDLGPERMWLGNGFVAKVAASRELFWRDLSDTSGTWTAVAGGSVQYGRKVAVDRTGVPLLAWVDAQGKVHVARLPVAPEGAVTQTWGVATAPAAPAAVVSVNSPSSLTVSWPAAAPGEQVNRYLVTRRPSGYYGATRELPGTATSIVFDDLTVGTPYTFTVVAENLAGSASTDVTGTPVYDTPPPPTGVTATVDRLTSRVTVTWDFVQFPQHLAPNHFRIMVNSAVLLDDVPLTARTASLVVRTPLYGFVTVYAVGTKDSGVGYTVNQVTIPGVDTRAPTARVTALAPVLLAGSTSLRYSGTDDRRVKDYQVAVRVAGTGQALGPWTYPSTWAHLTGTSLALTGLTAGSTRCYVVRARDDAGNTSPWSAAACTTVALDDRSWSRSTSGWSTSTSLAYYQGSATATSRPLQVLRRGSTRADAMTLVVTRCATCGTLGVYDDNVLVAKVNLYAATAARRVLVTVPFGGRRSGVLALKTLTTGKPVVVDGVSLRSY